jgi:hypothetical protein
MHKPTTLAWTTCACLLAMAGTSRAQEAPDPAARGRPVEVTPYVLMGSAGAVGGGAAVRWPMGSRLGLELESDVRQDAITAAAIALSLVYDLPAIGRVTPYVAASVGLQQHAKPIFTPEGIGVGTGTALTLGTGGGVRVPVNDRWGVRTDARWTHGVGRSEADQWRISNGATIKTGK